MKGIRFDHSHQQMKLWQQNMYDSMLSCREREEDEWEFFFQRKF
jgi:hypothetical protein